MKIPTFWARATGDANTPESKELALTAWGWSSASQVEAESSAADRLARMVARVVRGDPLPDRYSYGERPIREERLDELNAPDGTPIFVITRNGYGCLVINAARAMFIDVDLPPATRGSGLRSLFRKAPDPADAILASVRGALTTLAPRSFRIYRTAAGFRVLALDREYHPQGDETMAIMASVGADPAYMQLCKVQTSFRARLTPKPWRCAFGKPPFQFPRLAGAQEQFMNWVSEYDKASQPYATCHLVEQLGRTATAASVAPVLALHDQLARVDSGLPLA